MPRGVFNWTFHDIVEFLREHNFNLNHTEGSHHFYTGVYDGKFRQASVPFHGSKAINPRTLNSIIRQSGIARKEWLSW